MIDMSRIGEKIHQLTIVGVKKGKDGRYLYDCKCDCGNSVLVRESKIINGTAISCGCTRIDIMEKYGYIIGQKINKWTVLQLYRDNKKVMAVCMCECGTIKYVDMYNVINNLSKDYGCGRKQMLRETKTKNLVGEKFGKLTVIELLEDSNKFNRRLYNCQCDCGNTIILPSASLISGHTHSCGCLLSYYNMYIESILTKKKINHKSEYSVEINSVKYRFDFYLYDYNLFIEYDGEQHYHPVNFGKWDEDEMNFHFHEIQERDKIKNDYCINNNINLLRIPYWEKQNIETIINNYLQRLNEEGLTEAI